MITGKLIIHGEVYLTCEAVAHCYDVDVAWLVEVREYGLLGRVERLEDGFAVAAAALDRVARILQLQRQMGLELALVAHILGEDDPWSA